MIDRNGTILMKSMVLMNPKKSSKSIIIELIKKVLENRSDIKPKKDFIHDVASYTLERVGVTNLISERTFPYDGSLDAKDNFQLVMIIELLAIINKTIDIIALKRNFK